MHDFSISDQRMCHSVSLTEAFFKCTFHLITAPILNVSVPTVCQKLGKTLATQTLELVQREGRALEEGTLPFPASEHSFTLSLLCPAQHRFTPRHCFFANPHPVSFPYKHPAHGSRNSPSEGAVSWIHLPHVWLLWAECPCTAAVLLPPGAMAGIHSPAKLQGSAGGLQKHQASKQNLPNSHHLCTDKILNRASDKYRCKGVGRGKWDHFVHSFTAEQRDGTPSSQAHELSEVKNESAGNRIRGQMNVFPLNWDTLMALTLAKYFFHLSLTFHQKCGKKYSKCSRNALKNQFKILPQKILNSACSHISSHCPITGFNLNTVLQ